MLRFGTISDIDASLGMARVSFIEDGTVSDWMPLIVSKTGNDKFFYIPDVKEQVACMMDDKCLRGVILGAVYSDNRKPSPSDTGDGIVSIVFSNGDKIKYDGSTGQMDLKASGGVVVYGDITVSGTIHATTDITVGLFNISLLSHTHLVAGVQAGAGSVTSNPPS
jgi:phage baseplate assembly protein V